MIKEELKGLNGNTYSATRYLYASIKLREDKIIARGGNLCKKNAADISADKKGGMIVFSTDANNVNGLEKSVINWIKNRWKTIKTEMKNNKTQVKRELGGWAMGKFLSGKYEPKNGKLYDENSLSINIVGVKTNVLISIAEDLCIDFKQDTLLVKDYSDRRIMLVNGEKEDVKNMSDELDKFLKNAKVILVDDAFSFDINKWEQECHDKINEELESCETKAISTEKKPS